MQTQNLTEVSTNLLNEVVCIQQKQTIAVVSEKLAGNHMTHILFRAAASWSTFQLQVYINLGIIARVPLPILFFPSMADLSSIGLNFKFPTLLKFQMVGDHNQYNV